MFKFFVVLCVIFVASTMESSWVMVDSPGVSVTGVHRKKLSAVLDYANLTMRYANQTLDKISRHFEEYKLAMKEHLLSHVDQIKHDVENLTNRVRNVDTYVCQNVSNTLTTMLYDEGAHLLENTNNCIGKHVSEASWLNRKIDEIFKGELERIDTIREHVQNCRVNGNHSPSVAEYEKCLRTGTRQIARGGGVFINDVQNTIHEMESLLNNIFGIQDECGNDAGFPEYYRPSDDIVRTTRECIDRRVAESAWE